MHINCVICSDLFVPTAEVYVTKCGHLFHYHCLLNWIQRNPSCPQCRSTVTESRIHRVYFNLSLDESFSDVGALVNKLENLECQHSRYQKDINNYKEKIQKFKKINVGLRGEVAELEEKERVHVSAMHALKEQITYFKNKSKETDRLTEEIIKLKGIIKDTENVRTVLEGTREQANQLLINEDNIESLTILSVSLKKALLEAEKKKRDIDYNLKRVQNELSKYKKLYSDLNSEYVNLKREHQHLKSSFKLEKEYLKNKLNESPRGDNTVVIDSSIECIGSENSIIITSPRLNTSDDKCSRSVAEKSLPTVVDLTSSHSPYLTVKSNPLMAGYGPHLNTKLQTKPTSPKKGYSIFKSQQTKIDSSKSSKNEEICYNGLGGSSREDIYPSPNNPKPSQKGTKRHLSSTLTTNKLKKLAPLCNEKKK